jgi:uncharacterized membrane protein YhaH (DUF805 family)
MDQMDINKLWQNFVDVVTNHYSDFAGRMGRAQYWYYILVYFIVGVVVAIVGGVIGMAGELRGLYSLALLLPTIGMTARRLQDTGKPGSWAWLLLVPFGFAILMGVMAIIAMMTFGLGLALFALVPLFSLVSLAAVAVVIYFCAQPGEAGANASGPAPAAWTPGGTPTTPPAAS